jgi:pSer/pThr/pTyr-binding forkhead associated (FHA) protein/DNA-directed RNA polymerase subunit RPC12/RpoP
MQSLTSGTFVGAGSFRCTTCDFTLTLAGTDTLTDCPSCGGKEFVRASLFSGAERGDHEETQTGHEEILATPAGDDMQARVAQARTLISEPGEYLLLDEGREVRTIALTREWTRIGRSLAADVRFDDPTVSRRHALIVRQADGVRLLDDRSLNGVFVNGARVDGKALQDGDEIIVGRYRLLFASVPPAAPATTPGGSDATSVHTIG